MTDRQWVGLAMVVVGLAVAAVLVWVVLSRRFDDEPLTAAELEAEDEEDAILCAGCLGFDHCDGRELMCECRTCGWDQEWDDDTLASLHEDPPTDERLERVVLALVESPEEWRRRMEAEDNDWRLRVQNTLGLAVDFGDRLELVA